MKKLYVQNNMFKTLRHQFHLQTPIGFDFSTTVLNTYFWNAPVARRRPIVRQLKYPRGGGGGYSDVVWTGVRGWSL